MIVKYYKKLFVFGLFLLLVILGACNKKIGLATDKEMIEHFYQNKKEIEELVHRYRTFEVKPKESHDKWKEAGDTSLLMEKAKVSRIEYLARDTWLPDPYSLETAKIKEQIKFSKNYVPLELPFSFYKHGMLKIEFLPREKYMKGNIPSTVIWKNLVFIPEVPRIENGYLLGPIRANGEYSFKNRVVLSTDVIPNWKEYECVYKQIEPQWFLQLCNGH